MTFQNVIKNNIFLRCFSDFLGLKSFKKNLKQLISTKLDKGFRLVYKLSYLVEDKFWSIFAHKGGPLPKKVEIFFPTRYEKNLKQHISTKLDKGFRLVYKLKNSIFSLENANISQLFLLDKLVSGQGL